MKRVETAFWCFTLEGFGLFSGWLSVIINAVSVIYGFIKAPLIYDHLCKIEFKLNFCVKSRIYFFQLLSSFVM